MIVEPLAERLRDGVRNAYSAVAAAPEEKHAFPVGRAFAESVGYTAESLSTLPTQSIEAFAGVSNVSVFAELPLGASVLDLGCGAGLDSLIAARRVGPTGAVTGVDFSAAMIDRASRAAAAAQCAHVHFLEIAAERLPFPDESFDVAIVNGIFNLNPARDDLFGQLARVLKRGACAYVAELILQEPLPEAVLASESNWFA